MSEDQRSKDKGRDARSVSYTTITIIIAVAGALGAFGALGMVAGAQKQRIEMIQARQIEDRTMTGARIEKIDTKIERIDSNVTAILIEVRAMQEADRRTK